MRRADQIAIRDESPRLALPEEEAEDLWTTVRREALPRATQLDEQLDAADQPPRGWARTSIRSARRR